VPEGRKPGPSAVSLSIVPLRAPARESHLMLSFFTTSFAVFIRPTQPVRELSSRVRRSRHRLSVRARVTQLFIGLLCVGSGIGMILQAGLGVASWDVLNVALSQRFGVPLGVVAVAVGLGAGAIATALGARPSVRTLIPLFVVSPVLELAVRTVTTPATLVGQFGLLLSGMVVLSLGVGAYIGSENGAGPADLLFLSLAERGLPVWAARVSLDGTVVLAGWLLGGPVGVGTVLVTAGIGPMIALTLRWFDLLHAHETVTRRNQQIDHAWGLELHDEMEGYLPASIPPWR
jgi:uncharacterized membrane protein YczE